MKRNHKIGALAFSMFAGMLVVATPQVRADEIIAEAFENTCAKSDAEIVLSVNASETELHPGDTFTLSFDLDKLPSNGYGVNGISFKLGYDAEKVSTEVKTDTNSGSKTKKLTLGSVGTYLGFKSATVGSNGDLTTIAVGAAISAADCKDATEEGDLAAGNIFTIEFTVLEDATSGELGFKLFKNTKGDIDVNNIAGMAASGVKFDTDELAYVTDGDLPFYIESNLSDCSITVEATSVTFDEVPTSAKTLDTVTNKTSALASYLKIDPTAAQGNTVTWTSSDNSVATVDVNGTVTAVGNGTATITATVDGLSASVDVSVVVAPEEIEFSDTTDLSLDCTTNKTASLKSSVKVTPSDAKVESLEWSSSDPTVATVDQNGTVTAVGNGEATITVKYGTTLSATKTVKVTTSVSSVSLAKTSVVLDTDENTTATVAYTINPTTAEVKNAATVTSSDESVATAVVNDDGTVTVTAKKYGTANVTLTVDGKTSVMSVKVTVTLKSIEVSDTDVTFYKGDDASVTVTPSPEGSAWETLDAAVKSGTNVKPTADSSTGVVSFEGLERGSAVVTVYADGNQTGDMLKEVNVTVKENRVTSITLTADETEVLRGKTLAITSSYETEEDEETVHKTTDDTTITWTSSDTSVATVDQNGTVTAVGEGEVVITATMANSADKVSQTYNLTVIENHLEAIEVSDEAKETLSDTIELTTEGSVVIPFTVVPEDCTDTAEEVIAKITEGLVYDSSLVNVEVTYDPETGAGYITVSSVAAGEGEVVIPLGFTDSEDEEVETITLKLSITEPVEEDVETSDMPVVAMTVLMVVSLGGIVVTKKELVK